MVSIILPDHLAQQLEEIARNEKRPLAEVIEDMVQHYIPTSPSDEKAPDWESIIGIYDDDVTDMSTSVRETLQAYFQKKYANPD